MKLLPIDYAVRNLGRSTARLLLSVLGSALVVLLVLAAAAFVRGMDASLRSTGHPDNVIILGSGSEESIERSEIEAGVGGLVTATIQGIRTRAGQAYVSPEVHVQLPVKTDPQQERGPTVLVRGVTPPAMLVHSDVQVVEGRPPRAGYDEVMVGAMVHVKLGVAPEALALGNKLYIDDRPLTIVGRFASPGTVTQAELWVPLTDLKQATKRETDSCVVLTLDRDKADASDVELFARTRFDLEITSTPEQAYYARLSQFFAPIRIVAWVTAGLIGIGGLFGGLNTMYAAFASRVREIGTLQSLGFRRGAIVVSLVQESVLATCAGSLLAAALGLLLLDGLAVRFSMGAFGLRVDAVAMIIALGSGIVLGLVGSLPPAWRCLRLSIPVALKSI
ncbi:MAG TPA: ABC transporter permease [Phycisphaerales bacterium]|nr:ABC transporter permease [Phycisphaerales bacterium]